MSAGTKVLTWLTDRLEEKEGGVVCGDEAYKLYEDYCKAHNILIPATRSTFGKLVKKIFPFIGFRYLHQKFYYKGLSLAPETVENNRVQLPEFCTIESMNPLTIAIPTLFVVDNKPLAFSVLFTQQDMKVSIQGKDIDLEIIGCSSENTPKNLKAFAKCAPKLPLCQGLEWSEQLEIRRTNTVVEEWSKTGEDDPARKRIRSHKCCIVVALLYSGNICRRCQNFFYTLRNKKLPPIKTEDSQPRSYSRRVTKSTQTVAPTITESTPRKKIPILINSVAQYAPEGFRALLESQVYNHTAKYKQRLRWNPHVVAMCRSVLNSSRRAYLELCRSGLLVLPSIRSLTRRRKAREIRSRKEEDRRGSIGKQTDAERRVSSKESKMDGSAGSVSGAAQKVSIRTRRTRGTGRSIAGTSTRKAVAMTKSDSL